MGSYTFNPNDKHTDIVLSNGNIDITSNSQDRRNARGISSVSGGKYYFEQKNMNSLYSTNNYFGITHASLGLTSLPGGSAGSGFSYSGYRRRLYFDGSYVTPTSSMAYLSGDIIMFAFDLSNGKVWLGKNGTWFNSGNPAAGTGQAATIASLIGLDWYVVGSLNSSADTFRVHFDDAHYSYTRPTGFSEFTFIENFYYVTCDDEYYRLRD